MKTNSTMQTTRKTTQTFRLTGEDIVDLLAEAGHIDAAHEWSVRFYVPSGGDCSGESLDVNNDAPVLVRVENEEEVIT